MFDRSSDALKSRRPRLLAKAGPDEAAPQDLLGEMLQDLRPVGISYGHCRLTRPWGVAVPDEQAARFHFVIAGESWLRVGAAAPVRLQPGDVAFLPRGAAHRLSDTPRGRTRPLADFPREEIGERTYRLRAGGNGVETLMACCSAQFRSPSLHPLLALMPPVIVVRGATVQDATLPALLDAIADEVMGQRLGSATVMARLADVVMTRLIRAWVEEQEIENRDRGGGARMPGWLTAMRDPKIGRALAALHRDPGAAWSIELLADVAGQSRSLFHARFTALIGMPPARYLSRWRMHLAGSWLREERLSIGLVAERLGYESDAAFSRAFKREIGVPPSALRRRAS